MQHTSHTKLQAIRDSRKRWQSRLTRAANMLRKLDQKERRLLKVVTAVDLPLTTHKVVTDPAEPEVPVMPKPPAPDVEWIKRKIEERQEPVPVISTNDPDLVEKVAAALESNRDDLKIPAFLSRKPDEGTAIAAKKTAVDKAKMPLSDREARDYIRKQSIAVEKKREKKDRAFFKTET